MLLTPRDAHRDTSSATSKCSDKKSKRSSTTSTPAAAASSIWTRQPATSVAVTLVHSMQDSCSAAPTATDRPVVPFALWDDDIGPGPTTSRTLPLWWAWAVSLLLLLPLAPDAATAVTDPGTAVLPAALAINPVPRNALARIPALEVPPRTHSPTPPQLGSLS